MEGYTLVATTTTDANGKYSFANLPEGVYRVVVVMDGYESHPSRDIALTGNDTADGINFRVNSSDGTVTPDGAVTRTEISDAPIVRVYPNPTNAMISLEFETEGVYIVTLTDLTGKILLRQTVNDRIIRIDISNYPPGLYLLITDDSKRQNVMRVVKN